MRTAQKRIVCNFLGYKIHLAISKTKKKKSQSNYFSHLIFTKTLLILTLILLSTILFYSISKFQSDAYFTKSAPLLSQISPFLSNDISGKVNNNFRKVKEKIIFKGSDIKRAVALTFDADMTPEMIMQLEMGLVDSAYNKQVVDVLNETKTKATFFISGLWIEKYPDVTKSFAVNPLFELANHSYSHPSFEGTCYGLKLISDQEQRGEIQKTQELLKKITGTENKWFRFPGGCYSEKDLEILHEMGVTAIQWDVVGRDGFNNDAANIEENVLSQVKNGSIIVLHMNGYPNSPLTAMALPGIIKTLRDRGYEFVKISELLDEDRYMQAISPEEIFSELLVLK
jgi:peptidoglycan-N-acetylglucosamine deacetylase